MPFRFTQTAIPDLIMIEPSVVADERGFFMESYKRSEFTGQGITESFVQCNRSKSARGVLRGLHYQKHPQAQAKLVWAVSGEIYDVVVDLRAGGPTYGRWFGATLSAENQKMFYVPQGFAHGFCVISAAAEIYYMTTEEYAPELEAGIIWNDPELAIEWPITEPVLSPRDREWPPLTRAENNFRYG
jgi:dTDP-4-dehydrorhamnose 3,5-epimerase